MIRSARKWLRRHPVTVWSAGAALVALVMTFTFTAGSAPTDLASMKKPTQSGSQHSGTARIPSAASPSAKPTPAQDAKSKSSKKSAAKADKKTSQTTKQSQSQSQSPSTSTPKATSTPSSSPSASASAPAKSAAASSSKYPMHTGIVSTTFWVGEIFDANAEDGSQMLSTYDGNWFANFGGCDGITSNGTCSTEKRVASNGFFPSSMTPKQNPFYLDLPYDDVNDSTAFKNRGTDIPWANDPGYAGKAKDSSISFMKNRWVKLTKDGQTCYGQIADAGPGEYHDATYVFGSNDARPANSRYGGAGMDVSPALNGCLNFSELDGDSDKVDWQFIEAADVPDGPWLTIQSNDNTVNP